MIRKNSAKGGSAFGGKSSIRPLYREIVPASLRCAWRDRWLWPFAIVAALLHTGGIYDTIFVTLREVRSLGGQVMTGGLPLPIQEAYLKLTGAAGILPAIGSIQSILFALVLIAGILGLSLICQGALAYGIANRDRGRLPGFRECLGMGARSLWKILVLNVVTLGLIWLGKFFMLLPWSQAVEGSNLWSVLLFILASLIYIAAVVALTAIHFFALYAIVINKAEITEALEAGLEMLKQSWLAVLELALILFVFGALLLAGLFISLAVAGIPVVLVMTAAALLGQSWIVSLGWMVATLLFFILALAAGAFCVTFQFNAWYRLGVRLGEGGILAKVHRWINSFRGYA